MDMYMDKYYYLKEVMYPTVCGFGQHGDLISIEECKWSDSPSFNSDGTWGREINGIHHVWFNMNIFDINNSFVSRPLQAGYRGDPSRTHLRKFLNRVEKLNSLLDG